MTELETSVTLAFLEDSRALIAALKIQRWEAFKWTVTVNLALATASTALRPASFLFLAFAICTAALGLVLVWHYSERASRVRARHRATVEHLNKEIFDFGKLIGVGIGAPKGTDYDKEELVVFRMGIAGSIVPALLALILS